MTTLRHGDRLALYRPPHVLVAHGEGIMRQGLAGILSRAGCDVDEAEDADEAMTVLAKTEFDALVVSFGLPPDGCRPLLDGAERLPSTVVLSASTDDVAEVSANPNVQTVLMRPFPLRAFYDAVEVATGQADER
jgi:DNA-binding response OmpR family regulator